MFLGKETKVKKLIEEGIKAAKKGYDAVNKAAHEHPVATHAATGVAGHAAYDAAKGKKKDDKKK